ncbi:putative transcription termination factor MTERF4, chloroplastic-like [Cocos nucifera]|uniref:Putative transcription termination factor MTERF4, chloroplastic-like n=1 Tax=Cocos nucifera TaxID=13894 RepID=A0A8K0I8P2_COCNU|nr:putative transcription termination factor MTERF4, chloroplastic-like [Cocos nucifera]
MGLLERRLFYLLSSSLTALKSTLLSFPHHLVFSLLRFSTATSQDPSPKPPFQVEYLINSCGLSLDGAVEASKYLAHLNSPKPISVVGFIKQFGFGDEHIRRIVSLNPRILCASVDNNLKPRIKVLQDLGFSDAEIIQLVSSNPVAFICGELQHRIEFWRPLFGTNAKLLKAFERNHRLLGFNLGPNLKPMMSLGWSEADVAFWISKAPLLLKCSEKSICDKMDFLRKEVGCGLQYVAHRPGLLTYGLEGRMIPRYDVLKNLKANELPEGDLDFYYAVMISEDKFLNKFILPHKDRIPGLYETYVASTAGEVPIDRKI